MHEISVKMCQEFWQCTNTCTKNSQPYFVGPEWKDNQAFKDSTKLGHHGILEKRLSGNLQSMTDLLKQNLPLLPMSQWPHSRTCLYIQPRVITTTTVHGNGSGGHKTQVPLYLIVAISNDLSMRISLDVPCFPGDYARVSCWFFLFQRFCAL